MKQPMKDTSTSPPKAENQLVERLFVFWLASTIILLLALIVIALLGSGYLRRQTSLIEDLNSRIEKLERDMQSLEESVRAARARRAVGDRVATTQPPTGSRPAVTGEQPADDNQPGLNTSPAAGDESPETRIAELRRRIRGALKLSRDAPPALASAADAEVVGSLCSEADVRESMDGPLRAEAAVVLALIDRPAEAAALAKEARDLGVLPRGYLEIAARKALAGGEFVAAAELAREVLRIAPNAPEATLVLASASNRLGDHAGAIDALRNVAAPDRLSTAEKLELIDLLAAYWRWDTLGPLLAAEPLASTVDPRVARARAAFHAHVGDADVALAIIDELRAQAPDDYDLSVYRAAALTRQRQYAAAAACLSVADAAPDRPEAWYWLGVLALREGKETIATRRFEQSVAASQYFAPANEALAALALNRDDILAARECADHAIQADDSRGEGHLLLALTAARLGERDTAAASLRAAFARNANLVDTALTAESILALFTPDEIAALAQPEPQPPAPASLPATEAP